MFAMHLWSMLNVTDVYLYGHNASRFDHYFLVEALHRVSGQFFESDETTAIICLQIKRKFTLHFRDTCKLLQGTLKSVGQLLGLQKYDMPITNVVTTELIEYCHQDVNICDAIIQWANKFFPHLNHICTYYSQAGIAYEQTCLLLPDDSYLLDWSILSALKQCYYGGRVDSCAYGHKILCNVSLLDIRSMYPSSLCHDLPYGPLQLMSSDIKRFLQSTRLGIALVRIVKTTASCYDQTLGLCPIKNIHSLVFINTGDVTAWFTSVDIHNLLADGWQLVKIHACFEWHYKRPFLREFFLKNYETRKLYPKSHPLNQAAKLMMNSSYGKFAQHIHREEESSRCYYVAWFCLSYSRCLLKQLKDFCKPALILYGDTDSVVISSEAAQRLYIDSPIMFSDELSYPHLRVDLERHNVFGLYVFAKKVYLIGDILKAKGANKLSIKIDELKNITLDGVVSCREAPASRTLMLNNDTCIAHIEPWRQFSRALRIVIPDFMYKCEHCSFLHYKFMYVKHDFD